MSGYEKIEFLFSFAFDFRCVLIFPVSFEKFIYDVEELRKCLMRNQHFSIVIF